MAVVGYYGSWSAYRGFTPEIMDPSLCTHLIYAFVGINDDGTIKVLDWNLDCQQGLFRRVVSLKKRNPRLKVLVSVGGANDDNDALFRAISSNPIKRNAFIMSALHFLKDNDFDGLDIDWEYPTIGDRNNFILLLKELRSTFQLNRLMLTAAVASSPKEGYDVPQMIRYVDFLNVMTYDFYGSWSNYTGQNSALYPSPIESEWERANLNIVAAATNWVNSGAPKWKLAIGTSFYGRSFTLRDPNQHGLHAPISGAGRDGGTPLYSTINTEYNHWNTVRDRDQQNLYKFFGDQWVGYDDIISIQQKGEWIRENGFFGAMVWTIDGDLHLQPLLKALKSSLPIFR